MTITARTLISNPAAISLAVVSIVTMGAATLFVGNMFGRTCHNKSLVISQQRSSPCETVRRANGFDRASWSEFDWFRYSQCFALRNDSRRTIEVASQGLKSFPRSEALFNTKGYHLIRISKHSEAIKTLQLGLRRVGRPTSSVMPNNLAWAGLWSPRDMELTEARGLYKLAIRTNPKSCESIHTGLMVEYGISKSSVGFARVEALKSFAKLSESYTPCMSRYKQGSDWGVLTEVIGAAVLIQDVNIQLKGNNSFAQDRQFVRFDRTLTPKVLRSMKMNYRNASMDYICREAIPFATEHHMCKSMLSQPAVSKNVAIKNRIDAKANPLLKNIFTY